MHGPPIHRPRNVDWKRAAALLYGDWGTSKAYVIGYAFLAMQFASLHTIIAVSAITGLVGLDYLVEDEVMIRMMVADMLEELGYKIAAEAGDITEAMRLAQATEFDIAILDVNVNGKVISPVADVIKAKGCPFIFATGYGTTGLTEPFQQYLTLQKPFEIHELERAIRFALAPSSAAR